MWILCHQFPSMYFQKTWAIRYLLVIYYNPFIAHISAPTLDSLSLSYMSFPNYCNTLLHNVRFLILIHVRFCHVFFTCHKHKKMEMFGHIILQEKNALYMKLGGFKYNQCWHMLHQLGQVTWIIHNNLLDRKGDGVRTLFNALDFTLGIINNESVGMPWWVIIMNVFTQCVHPWCEILLLTSWCDVICYKNAIVPLVKHYHGIKGKLPQFIIDIC
jgi:hypothetical protein